MQLIELIADLIHRNLVLTVALALIPLKLLMVRLCKDQDGEWETVMSMPEDLCYVSVGLLLSSLTAGRGPLQTYFSGFPHPRTDVAIILAINFALIVVLHKISQSWTRVQYMHWRAALAVRGDQNSADDLQLELNLSPSEDNVLHVLIHHLVGLLGSLLIQFVVVGFWLYRIAEVFSSR